MQGTRRTRGTTQQNHHSRSLLLPICSQQLLQSVAAPRQQGPTPTTFVKLPALLSTAVQRGLPVHLSPLFIENRASSVLPVASSLYISQTTSTTQGRLVTILRCRLRLSHFQASTALLRDRASLLSILTSCRSPPRLQDRASLHNILTPCRSPPLL